MPFVKEGATVPKLVDGEDFLFLNISFEDIASWQVNRGPPLTYPPPSEIRL